MILSLAFCILNGNFLDLSLPTSLYQAHWLPTYLKSLSIVDVDLSNLEKRWFYTNWWYGDWIESSQTRQLRSLIGFWLVNLSNDVVAGFPMDIVAFCLLLNIVLNHCLILQEKLFFLPLSWPLLDCKWWIQERYSKHSKWCLHNWLAIVYKFVSRRWRDIKCTSYGLWLQMRGQNATPVWPWE